MTKLTNDDVINIALLALAVGLGLGIVILVGDYAVSYFHNQLVKAAELYPYFK